MSAHRDFNMYQNCFCGSFLSECCDASLVEFILIHSLILYQTTNSRPFQTERVGDDNFKFGENGRKLSKWVENTVGKGEIAHNE